MHLYFDAQQFKFAGIQLENGIGEALDCVWDEDEDAFQITRHSAGWNTKEARDWIKEETKEREHGHIWEPNNWVS